MARGHAFRKLVVELDSIGMSSKESTLDAKSKVDRNFWRILCGDEICRVTWGQVAVCWMLRRQGLLLLAGVFTRQ